MPRDVYKPSPKRTYKSRAGAKTRITKPERNTATLSTRSPYGEGNMRMDISKLPLAARQSYMRKEKAAYREAIREARGKPASKPTPTGKPKQRPVSRKRKGVNA